MSSDDTTSYPVEFLNGLDLSGVPLHKLELKVGVPVLLMRKLDSPRLCNDTLLRITELGTHILKATILTEKAKRDNVLIPRTSIIPNNLPFNFKPLKFPLKVVFSMTINKSQGQTLKGEEFCAILFVAAPHQVVLQHIDFCTVQSIAKLPT
ncbi:ATP-dependent DNA helicase [Trichonephila clavipes]|nr:ATP-dependent DNA helicase [Trichonephila clavipes]